DASRARGKASSPDDEHRVRRTEAPHAVHHRLAERGDPRRRDAGGRKEAVRAPLRDAMVRLLLIDLLLASSAHAQYPAKPVRIVVGYAAGSSTDIVGRVMADRLGAYWNQGVYFEDPGGAA